MSKYISIAGPVEMIDDQLGLRIPLDVGGSELQHCTQGLSRVEGNDLIVPVHNNILEKIGVRLGERVVVDNENGKFNMRAEVWPPKR